MSSNRNTWLFGMFRRVALVSSAFLFALIPFSCGGQSILRTVTPFLLGDSHNIIDDIIWAVAPLVLP